MFVFIIIESPDDTNEEDNDTTNILTLYLCIVNEYQRKGLEAGVTDSEDESTTCVQEQMKHKERYFY